MMSEICATSSLAATRGATFLPEAVAGNTMWLWPEATASTCAARFSASPSARGGASAASTLATPAAAAACSATAWTLLPATSTCTSPPSWAAAAMAFSVAPFRWALSRSAITSVVISAHLRFVLQFVHPRCHVIHLDAGHARRRLGYLQRLEPRRRVHPQFLGRDRVQRLLLGLHDVGQRHVARLVQAQVRLDNGRQL